MNKAHYFKSQHKKMKHVFNIAHSLVLDYNGTYEVNDNLNTSSKFRNVLMLPKPTCMHF